MRTHILLIADMSGSMAGFEQDVIGGINSYVADRVKDEHKAGDDMRLTLVRFDDKYEPLYVDKAPAEVTPLSQNNYVPRGSTALNDSVGRALAEVEGRARPEDRAFVLIFTDGHENASKEFTTPQIKARIEKLTGTGDWTFTFLGADQNAWDSAAQYGIAAGNSMSFGKGDIRPAMRSLSRTTGAYVAAPAKSMAGTTSDYVDDKGNLTTPDEPEK